MYDKKLKLLHNCKIPVIAGKQRKKIYNVFQKGLSCVFYGYFFFLGGGLLKRNFSLKDAGLIDLKQWKSVFRSTNITRSSRIKYMRKKAVIIVECTVWHQDFDVAAAFFLSFLQIVFKQHKWHPS